jgi:hypothetical protein
MRAGYMSGPHSSKTFGDVILSRQPPASYEERDADDEPQSWNGIEASSVTAKTPRIIG